MASAPLWDRYIGAGGRDGSDISLFVDTADVEVLREFEGQPEESVKELIESDGELASQYARALWKVVSNITEYSVVRYALTAIEALLVQDLEKRAALFAGLSPNEEGGHLWHPSCGC